MQSIEAVVSVVLRSVLSGVVGPIIRCSRNGHSSMAIAVTDLAQTSKGGHGHDIEGEDDPLFVFRGEVVIFVMVIDDSVRTSECACMSATGEVS
jgi:hypothetical protein